jgi:hypothetical protein
MFMRESGFRRQCLPGQGEPVCAVSHIPRQVSGVPQPPRALFSIPPGWQSDTAVLGEIRLNHALRVRMMINPHSV